MRGAFSTILVHSLLFIAAAVATYLFITSLYKNLYDIQGAMHERERIISNRMKTIFDIDSCSYNNTTSTLSLYLTNRGTVALDPNKLNVFINGVLVTVDDVSFVNIVNDNGIWERYETIKIDLQTNEGEKFVKVVASNGAYDEKTIYISGSTCTII